MELLKGKKAKQEFIFTMMDKMLSTDELDEIWVIKKSSNKKISSFEHEKPLASVMANTHRGRLKISQFKDGSQSFQLIDVMGI